MKALPVRMAVFALAVCLAGCVLGQAAENTPAKPPSIDKQKIDGYLRYAEGFSPTVKLLMEDPAPTPMAGYYRLVVHLSMGDTKQDKTYYVTADGQHILGGPVWELNGNPFEETLARLPAGGIPLGPTDAKIKLVVFSDFQCPYCREFARTLRDNIEQKYPKDVRVTFKDFPIEAIHPWARAAAEAAHCIGDGKPEIFWQYHDWIFQHQGEITPGNLSEKTLSFAQEHGVDAGKVKACIDSRAPKDIVEASLKEGRSLDVVQTPTFFLNGRMVPGALPWKSLDTLIQMELNRPSSVPGAAAAR
jgi:protein-disulfide isomerase